MHNKFPTKPAPETKRKRTLFEVIKNKIIEKPATKEEIEQLKLNKERAGLKADIATLKRKAKAAKPNPLSLFVADKQTNRADGDDLRKAVGTNNKNKYKDLIGDRD